MGLVGALVVLFAGIGAGIGIVFILQKERIFTAVNNIKSLADSYRNYLRERDQIQKDILLVKREVNELKGAKLRLLNELNAMKTAWHENETSLQSTNRVNADEAMIFGRGQEWVYLYTFPAHEELAQARQTKTFPMKLGMSAQSNVVDRIHQQVSGNSTAISERAVIRLVFRVNSSREMERWMHDYLKRNGRQVSQSVGVEWFNTNPTEVERLFRSYVLQGIEETRPAVIDEFVGPQ